MRRQQSTSNCPVNTPFVVGWRLLLIICASVLQSTKAWTVSRIHHARPMPRFHQSEENFKSSACLGPCQQQSRRPFVQVDSLQPFRRHGPSLTALSLSSSSSITERDQETLSLVRQAIDESQGADAWQQAIAFLAPYYLIVSLSDDANASSNQAAAAAELCLADAFGWKRWVLSSATLRKYQTQPVVPTVDSLQQTMDWLRQGPLGLAKDAPLLQTCLFQHAALYLKDPQTLYRRAIQSAPRAYRDADAFRTLVAQDPTVLDVFYNCGDEDDGCASNCGNCWVTYQRKL